MKKRLKIRIHKKRKPKMKVVTSSDRNDISAQKLEMKKKRRIQRLKRRMVILLVFTLTIGAVLVLFKAPFFNINQVLCVGQEKLTEKEIMEIAKVEKGKNIFLTNIGNVKERVKSIPYVSESNARRIFPDKVKIWVREAVPVFAIEKDKQFMICDINTKVLETVKENKDNLCTFTLNEYKFKQPGEIYLDAEAPHEKKLLELIGILEKYDMINYVNNIDFSDISDIIILFDNRLKIKIGNTDEMDYKLKFINKVIREKISPYEKASVDYTGESLYVGQFDDETPEIIEENAEDNEKNTETTENEQKTEEEIKENSDGQKTT